MTEASSSSSSPASAASAKLASALALKEEGNKLFSENNFQKAIGKYTKIFAYTAGLNVSKKGDNALALALAQQHSKSDGVTDNEAGFPSWKP